MTLKVALQQERITANIKGQNYSWKIEWKLFKSPLMHLRCQRVALTISVEQRFSWMKLTLTFILHQVAITQVLNV